MPRGAAGFFARRKEEKQRDQLEKTYIANLERRLEALEKRLQAEPGNAEIHRAMGLLAMLENHWERANASLERAHELNSDDFETHINYGIVLAHRGQFQPALGILNEARQKWPTAPLVLFNMALVALQARRANVVHQAVDALEKMWLANVAIAPDFHDEALTARGLAFLQEGKFNQAKRALDRAARHSIDLHADQAQVETLDSESGDDAISIVHGPREGSPTEQQIEGKGAEADGLNNLALAEAESGEMDKAIQRLKAALAIEPGHPQVLNNLGVLAYRQGQLDVAFRYLDIARQVEEELHINEPATFNHLGVVLSGMGRLDESLEYFQRAGSHERAEFEVFYNLGRAFVEHGKPDRGVEYLRHAFAQEPNNADIHVVLGAAYLMRGKMQLYPEALKHLKRALQINSHSRSAVADLVLALMEIKNNDAAQKLLDQAQKLFPGDAETQYLAALLSLEGSGETAWAEAAQKFDVALNARPDLTPALYNSALCQFLMGFRDTSARLLEAATQRDASLGPAYYLIGYGHAVAKRDVEAIAAWQVAAKYEADNPDLYANLAALLYRKGDYPGATRAYSHAHRLLPTDANILSALGVTFAQQKMFSQAIHSLEQSLAINPRSAVTHSNIGLSYYLFSQVEHAMEHWRTVSKIDARYAASREEEQQRSFDDSVVSLRPIEWKSRVVKMAPVLPRPQTRLLPGGNARAYRPAITDTSLNEIVEQKREVERESRMLAWLHLKI